MWQCQVILGDGVLLVLVQHRPTLCFLTLSDWVQKNKSGGGEALKCECI
jgi:hypothetical protein